MQEKTYPVSQFPYYPRALHRAAFLAKISNRAKRAWPGQDKEPSGHSNSTEM